MFETIATGILRMFTSMCFLNQYLLKNKKATVENSCKMIKHVFWFVIFKYVFTFLCGGLMVSALVSGSSGLGSSPGRGHCVVFLGKTLFSHSASLHPGVQMGTGEFNAGGQPCDGLASHRGESRNTLSRFMPRKPELCAGLMGPRGPNADFTFT